MRRIDVLGVGLACFLSGGLLYLLFLAIGLDAQQAGIWAEAGLVIGLVVWLITYLLRVVTQQMTYNKQWDAYEESVLQKRLEELTPEELARLQAEIASEETVEAQEQ